MHQNQVATSNNPTQHYQQIIKQTLKQCNNVIQKENIWKYTNMNPTAPNLRATIKLHKPNTPVRPIINLENTPAYEIVEHLTETLHSCVHLPYTYNVHNSIQLMADLQVVELNKDVRICSCHIKNTYTNIPKIVTINIICNILESNSEIDMNIQKGILHILQIMTERNCFRFDQQYCKQTDGLVMDAPTT
jgi:hypothetical protein